MSSKMSKVVLGPVNSDLIKMKRKKGEIERIRQEAYKTYLP